jgi:hypothetical protein
MPKILPLRFCFHNRQLAYNMVLTDKRGEVQSPIDFQGLLRITQITLHRVKWEKSVSTSLDEYGRLASKFNKGASRTSNSLSTRIHNLLSSYILHPSHHHSLHSIPSK